MKIIRTAVKSLLILALGLFVLASAWACSLYGPSDAGKPAAIGQADPEPVTLGASYDEHQLKQALARHEAERAYAEAPSIFNESPTPEGWPALTPIDEIRVKRYPAYRAAIITDEQDGDSSGLFRPLFNHIKRKDIAMTAPVEMTYNDAGRENKMAFLYRTPDMGRTGSDAADPRVEVKDIPAHAALSIGLRGDYSHERFTKAVAKLNAWLAEQTQWQADGEPRYLGYNSPFVPGRLRYGEVQVPIKAVE